MLIVCANGGVNECKCRYIIDSKKKKKKTSNRSARSFPGFPGMN